MRRNNHMINILFAILVTCISCNLLAQEPIRVGTTTANFLEIGYGFTYFKKVDLSVN